MSNAVYEVAYATAVVHAALSQENRICAPAPIPDVASVAESVSAGVSSAVGEVAVTDGAVGATVSTMMTYVFELVGPPPVSLIRMRTFVVAFAAGVNPNESAFALSVQLAPPVVEYATAVRGDGVAVSVIVHVVAGFVVAHVPLV